MNLNKALLSLGLEVREVPGWKTRRTRGNFEPVGTVVHDSVRADCIDLIIDGRPGISGPLANLLISKDGSIDLVSSRRCHHAGWGAGQVLEEVAAGRKPKGDAAERGLPDSVMGNSHFYGIEVDNRSNGQDTYPDVQINSLIAACVAIRLVHPEWQGFREIHHREWTQRKLDMKSRLDISAAVASSLRSFQWNQTS